MAFDGILVHSLVAELACLQNGKIQKISQVGNNDFLFVIRKSGKNEKLFISLERNQYRVSLTDKEYIAPSNATMFAMLLRKHLEGGIITSISQYNLDRILTFDVQKINEFGDNKTKKMILELMGKNSNLILTDKEQIIIDAFKHNGISEDGKTILPKALYQYPSITKLNLFTAQEKEITDLYETITSPKDIVSKFDGISPLLAKYIYQNKSPLTALLSLKEETPQPQTILWDGKKDFTIYPIGETIKNYSSISLMLEDYFYQKTIETQVQEKSNNLRTHIEHTIAKLKNKLVKLSDELDDAKNSEKYKIYGEIIMNNLYQLPNRNEKEIRLFNYYTNEEETIPLDSKISIKANAQRYFTKYQKSKKAVSYITEQTEIAQEEIAYLNIILLQIKTANVKDIEEIKTELTNNHYLKEVKGNNQKKRKEKIEIMTYYTSEDTIIYVGKNNLQNEYVTHTLAKPNDLWMHVKDAPGSHVVLHREGDFNEEDIRTGAMLAAYYSTYQGSSSVAVDYTKARYVKKIPGKRNCFVTFTNQKTIYIDPSIEFIQNLKKTKI